MLNRDTEVSLEPGVLGQFLSELISALADAPGGMQGPWALAEELWTIYKPVEENSNRAVMSQHVKRADPLPEPPRRVPVAWSTEKKPGLSADGQAFQRGMDSMLRELADLRADMTKRGSQTERDVASLNQQILDLRVSALRQTRGAISPSMRTSSPHAHRSKLLANQLPTNIGAANLRKPRGLQLKASLPLFFAHASCSRLPRNAAGFFHIFKNPYIIKTSW